MFPRAPFALDRVASRHRLRAACQVVRERDFELVATRTLDLSDGGLLVSQGARDATVRLGDAVIVTFRPPRGDRWVDALGVVTRVVEGRRKSDPGRAFGVRLEPVDRASREAIKVALRRLPAVPAARTRREDDPALSAIAARFGRG